jgi:hypothetical protein
MTRACRKTWRHFVSWGSSLVVLILLGLGVWLWRIDWHRSVLVGVGACAVALLGPIPGLLTPESRRKWLVLVFVAALIGAGTWYAAKSGEQQLEETREDLSFALSALALSPAEMKDSVCKSMARPLQHLIRSREYEKAQRQSLMLQTLSPANGHALFFAGEAFRGLNDDGEMLTAFNAYLFNADKRGQESSNGDADVCYDRPSGYCAERAAWVDHLLANHFFARGMNIEGSRKTVPLGNAVAHELSMYKRRATGFRADATTLDSVDLLRRTAAQLKAMAAQSSEADSLANSVERARNVAP